jgi:uncharacterized transporter YbjL
MSLWDTIKTGLEQGLETLSDKSAEMSKIARLSWKRRSLHKAMNAEMTAMGKIVYEHAGAKDGDVLDLMKDRIKHLQTLETQLAEVEAAIEKLKARIDQKQVRDLKKDLEMGDGTIEQIVVDEQSFLSGKRIMDIKFPKNVLMGTIVREDEVIIPDGQTELKDGDKVTLLGKKEDVEEVVRLCGKK